MTRLSPALSFALLAFFYAAGFGVLVWAMSAENIIMLLNGLFIGAAVSLVIVYTPSGWRALKGDMKYVEVSVFLLGLFLVWLGVVITASTSLYVRAADLPSTTLLSTAWARWTVIWAAVLQIYAPDPGLGIFAGRDRKTLSLSLAAGGLVALAAIWAQDVGVLSQRFGLLDRLTGWLPW